MSSEFACDYCTACPRHPCHSQQEAATCPNCDQPGAYLTFDAGQVATWIRHHARYSAQSTALNRAADLIERFL